VVGASADGGFEGLQVRVVKKMGHGHRSFQLIASIPKRTDEAAKNLRDLCA